MSVRGAAAAAAKQTKAGYLPEGVIERSCRSGFQSIPFRTATLVAVSLRRVSIRVAVTVRVSAIEAGVSTIRK